MLFGKLAFVFEVMIYVGLGLPLANLLLGLLSGGGDVAGELGADADLSFQGDIAADIQVELEMAGGEGSAGSADLEGVGAQGGFLRFDVYSLCLALVVMGAMGVYALEAHTGIMRLIVLGIGIVMALGAYGLLYRLLIVPLKQNKSEAMKVQSLQFRHAIVTFRILKDSPGKIQTKDAVGAVISYRAELDPHICKLDQIEEGEEVVITELDKAQNLCYVTLAQRKRLS